MTASLARCCRKIFIGDVHGCMDELTSILKFIKHDAKRDELYFVGDLAVKGPKSREFLDFIQKTNNAYSVMGNHDFELLRIGRMKNNLPKKIKIPHFAFEHHIIGRDPKLLPDHVECLKSISTENVEYLASLPLWLSPHSKISVVHAGLIPELELNKQTAWDLMHVRNVIEKPTPKHSDAKVGDANVSPRAKYEGSGYHDLGVPWTELYSGPQHVFFGHDAKRGLQIADYATGLDTGCVYGGKLTAAIVKFDDLTGEIINEQNEKNYKFEDWENETQQIVPKSGIVHRIIQQDPIITYKQPKNIKYDDLID